MQFSVTSAIAVDTETTGLSPYGEDQPFAVALCNEEGETWHCEWPVDPFTRRVTPRKCDIKFLRSILEDEDVIKVFHNRNFDVAMLAKVGVQTLGRTDDTAGMARVCNSQEISLKLKDLALKYGKIVKDDEKELEDLVKRLRTQVRKMGWRICSNKHDGKGTYFAPGDQPHKADYWIPAAYSRLVSEIDASANETYCRQDTYRTMFLYQFYTSIMAQDEALRPAYEKEMRLMPIVAKMVKRGMSIDRNMTEAFLIQYTKSAVAFTEEAKRLCGMPDLNLNSPQQLVAVIYGPEGFGLEPTRFTAGGKTGKKMPATDWKALRPYNNHPFVRAVSGAKNAEKAVSTFFQKYLDCMHEDPLNPGGWVVNPGLNQFGTVTFRFSCANPNLQQASRPDSANGKEPVLARAPFGPRPGYFWYCIDYSQQELRLFAELANIPRMLEAIYAGRDLNNENTDAAWGGRGNPAGIEAAANALEMGNKQASRESVQEAWDTFGWNAKKSRMYGPRSEEAKAVCNEWLDAFDYSIIAAEKSLGKSQSRVRAKNIMFAKIYGGGYKAVMDFLFCTAEEAKRFMMQLERPFPEMRGFMRRIERQCASQGFIVTPYGNKIMVDRNYAYQGVNYLIQGTAAQIVKSAIIKVDEYLESTGLDAHLIMPIHDELILEVKQEDAKRYMLRRVARLMEDTEGRLRVPMTVEIKRVRQNWHLKDKEAIAI